MSSIPDESVARQVEQGIDRTWLLMQSRYPQLRNVRPLYRVGISQLFLVELLPSAQPTELVSMPSAE